MATRKSQCQDSNGIKRKRKRMHSFEIHSNGSFGSYLIVLPFCRFIAALFIFATIESERRILINDVF